MSPLAFPALQDKKRGVGPNQIMGGQNCKQENYNSQLCNFCHNFGHEKSDWSIFHLAHSTPLPLQTKKGGSRKRTGGMFALTIHKSSIAYKSGLVGRVAGKTILIFCTIPARGLWSGPDRRRGPNGQTYAPISAQIDRCNSSIIRIYEMPDILTIQELEKQILQTVLIALVSGSRILLKKTVST